MRQSNQCATLTVLFLVLVTSGQVNSQIRRMPYETLDTVKRTQERVRQNAQAQFRQQIRAQANVRMQADASRAARIAQQASALAIRNVKSVRTRTPDRVRLGVESSASAKGNSQIDRQSSQIGAASKLGVFSDLLLPRGITHADVKVYDNIFGKYNPLRPQPVPVDIRLHANSSQSASVGNSAAQNPQRNPRTPSGTNRAQRVQQASNDPATSSGNNRRAEFQQTEPDKPSTGSNRREPLWTEIDFATRIRVAARQRRAEISQLRDRALEAGDLKLMKRAQEMESMINAFVKAQVELKSEAKAGANSPPQSRPGPAPQNRPSPSEPDSRAP